MRSQGFEVSVVVPTFNRRDLIGRTLHSVLSQTHLPKEIIVVDDGSTEDVRAVVDRYPVRYHRIVNSGPNVARAVGLELVRSPWVAFCDDDDEWAPEYLASWASAFADGGVYGFSNFRSIIEGRWTKEDKFADAPGDFFGGDTSSPFYPKLLTFNAAWPSCVIGQTHYFRLVGGFDRRLPRAATEDLEFSLRCNEQVRALVQHRPLVGIRRHAGNLTANKLRVCLWDVEALIWARDHHATAPRHRQLFEKEIALRRVRALEIAFTLGDTQVVRELAAQLSGTATSPKVAAKVLLCRSRVVPGGVLRTLFGPGQA